VYTTKKKKKTVFLLLQSQPSLTLYVFKTAPCFFVFGVVKGFVFISSAVSQKKKMKRTHSRKKEILGLPQTVWVVLCEFQSLNMMR